MMYRVYSNDEYNVNEFLKNKGNRINVISTNVTSHEGELIMTITYHEKQERIPIKTMPLGPPTRS